MCLAVPLRVVSRLAGGKVKMETGRVVTSLVKNVAVGDYLICRQNLGIEKLSPSKAKLIRDALRQRD